MGILQKEAYEEINDSGQVLQQWISCCNRTGTETFKRHSLSTAPKRLKAYIY